MNKNYRVIDEIYQQVNNMLENIYIRAQSNNSCNFLCNHFLSGNYVLDFAIPLVKSFLFPSDGISVWDV